MKKTQLQFVKNHLLEHGQISRNFCLQNFISRLGAIICILKEEGFEIEGDYLKTAQGKDYVYKLKNSPYKKVEYRVDGVLVETKYVK